MRCVTLISIIVLLALVPARAEIKTADFDVKECHWRHSLDLRDCEKYRKNPGALKKYVAYLNSLPGESNDDKVLEDVRRFCKKNGYRGGAPGERIQIVDYCSALDGFHIEPTNVIRSADGQTWVFRKGSRLLYVDRKSGVINQVVSDR